MKEGKNNSNQQISIRGHHIYAISNRIYQNRKKELYCLAGGMFFGTQLKYCREH